MKWSAETPEPQESPHQARFCSTRGHLHFASHSLSTSQHRPDQQDTTASYTLLHPSSGGRPRDPISHRTHSPPTTRPNFKTASLFTWRLFLPPHSRQCLCSGSHRPSRSYHRYSYSKKPLCFNRFDMAMLASRSAYSAPHSASTQPSSAQYSNVASYRIGKESNGFFASPTESEFSEHYDGAPDSIKCVLLITRW